MADQTHLEKMGRELKCPICLSLLNSAVSLTCNHVFCNACIMKSMKSDPVCPVCKVPYGRREVRAAPHMDNLVSVYKSMEAASGVNIFVTQSAPTAKPSDEHTHTEADSKCSRENLSCQKDQQALRRKGRTSTKKPDLQCPSSIILKPTFPTKKRVHVPQCLASENQFKTAAFDRMIKKSDDALKKISACCKEDNAPNINKERAFSPFFWLRDDEGEEDHLSQFTEDDQLLEISPPNVPSFSDLKDSDCDGSQAEEHDKSKVHFDSEMFEWTQRPCSPELLPSPTKSQVPDTEDTGQVQEMGLEAASLATDEDNTGNAYSTCGTSNKSSNRSSSRLNKTNTRQRRGKSMAKGRKSEEDVKGKCNNNNRDWVSGFQIDLSISEGLISGENADDKSSSMAFGKSGKRRKQILSSNLAAKPKAENDPSLAMKLRDKSKHDRADELSGTVAEKQGVDNVANVHKRARGQNKSSQCSSNGSKKRKLDSATGNTHEEVSTAKLKAIKRMNVQNHLSTSSNANDKKNCELKEYPNEVEETNLRLVSECVTESSCDDEIRVPSKGALGDGLTEHDLQESCRNVSVKRSEFTKKVWVSHVAKFPNGSAKVGRPPLASCVALRKCTTLANEIQCAFCHSCEDAEASGDLIHYYNGRPVSADYDGGSKIIHSHRSCTEWAPNVYFEDEIAINMEAELARSRRIKCSSCGLKGAALGCYEKSCRKSFHFPCAKLIPECRWDTENFVMLCPLHSSLKLPFENTNHTGRRQKNTSNRHQLPIKSDINANHKLNLLGLSGKLVLCCSVLTAKEKEVVSEFDKVAGVTVLKKWESKVTHVIASTDENGACKRTLKVLMGILEGKWILSIEWVKGCLQAMKHVEEEQYEIALDVHGIRDGPRLGRQRLLNKLPKLFDGLKFYFMGDFEPSYRGYLQDLVIAAGGKILHRKPTSDQTGPSFSPSSSTFIIYNASPNNSGISKTDMISDHSKSNAAVLASSVGAKAVSNTWVLNSIAACRLQSPSE